MLSFLGNIIEVIEFVPDYIIWAIETLFNLFMDAIEAVFVLATSLIPLPSEPSPPEFLSEINWFIPVGAIISIATPIVLGYVSFLAIRWILQKAGEL